MVGVAQLVERWLVEPDVAGSSPVVHPNRDSRIALGIPVESAVVSARASIDHPSHGSQSESNLLEAPSIDKPWITIVWNDPVNLMSYVSYVFRSYFGFDRATAEKLMMNVHVDGRAVVATGPREEMERHVEAMHDYGLWATLERQST
jgi:ATP-dependent Clp protease adaptor protein ClpS